MPDDVVPVDVAAREHGLHRDTIFKWLREGRLRRYRAVGERRTLVSRKELEDLTAPRPAEEPRPERPRSSPAVAARAEPSTSAPVTATDELRPLAAAIVPRSDRLLMTLRRYGKHGESWSWPSGRPEPGESLESALVRELDEELQLAGAEVLAWVGDIDLPSGYRMSHFAVEVPINAEPVLVDHEELVETRWMTLPEVEQAISSLPAYIRDQALDFARQVLNRATV